MRRDADGACPCATWFGFIADEWLEDRRIKQPRGESVAADIGLSL